MNKKWYTISTIAYFLSGNVLMLGSQLLFQRNTAVERNSFINCILLILTLFVTACYLLYYFKRPISKFEVYHIILPAVLFVADFLLFNLYPNLFNFIILSGSFTSIFMSFMITLYLIAFLCLGQFLKARNTQPTNINKKHYNYHIIFRNWGIVFFVLFQIFAVVNFFLPFIKIFSFIKL